MFDAAAFGPFIGDWKYETFVFRPYVKWVSETLSIDKIFISSHTNRLFLYDWIDKNNRIPVYEDISRNEILQNGFLHKSVSKSDYNIFVKQYKDELSKKCNCYINYFPINYTNFFQYPFYCRLYSKINTNKKSKGDYYLFIPDNTENIDIINDIYSSLTKEYGNDILVCGDMKTHLNEKNVVLSKSDYFENGYQYIISYINNAKAVICPMGFWTFIASLQNKPVFSWTTEKGNTVYRNHLANTKNTCIVCTNDAKNIINGFNNFVKELK
jgi:hypothetical protein